MVNFAHRRWLWHAAGASHQDGLLARDSYGAGIAQSGEEAGCATIVEAGLQRREWRGRKHGSERLALRKLIIILAAAAASPPKRCAVTGSPTSSIEPTREG